MYDKNILISLVKKIFSDPTIDSLQFETVANAMSQFLKSRRPCKNKGSRMRTIHMK